MKRVLILFVASFLATQVAIAKDADSTFADAILLKQVWVDNGMSCSSNGSGTVDDSGNVSTHSSGSCSQNGVAHYTVESGTTVYVLQPKLKHPKTAMFTLGYSAMFAKASVLHGVPLGKHFEMRIDKHGDAIVRVADGREAPYRVVEAESVPPAPSQSASATPAPRATPRVCLETVTEAHGTVACLHWAEQ